MNSETFRFVLNILDVSCFRYRLLKQISHKIVHTVHIILTQYCLTFRIGQTLCTLSKISECAKNYLSKQDGHCALYEKFSLETLIDSKSFQCLVLPSVIHIDQARLISSTCISKSPVFKKRFYDSKIFSLK